MLSLYETPTADRVCRAFAAVAVQTWRDLEDFSDLGEESITDSRILTLRRLCPNEVRAVKFNRRKEAETGADWEWWFGSGHNWFGMRIQAKKLDIASAEYRHLDYRIAGTGDYQVDRLLASAQKAGLAPLYCFYNFWQDNAVQPPWRCGTFAPARELMGVTVADAMQVSQRIRQCRKSISDLADVWLPLNCLTCCRQHASQQGPDTSLPFRARGVTIALRGTPEGVPETRQHPPEYVLAVLEGPAHAEFPDSVLALDGILIIQEDPKVYAGAYSEKPSPYSPVRISPIKTLPYQETITNSVGMQLARIPAGEFWMGSPETGWTQAPWDRPQHRVRITRPFYLGIFPVTQEQYENVMGENPSGFLGDPRRPVEYVSWFDAVNFCNRVSERVGLRPYYRIEENTVVAQGGDGYRLPTEAEWEYACRAGTTTKWSCGDDEAALDLSAWYLSNSGGTTHPVGEKEPNGWGLYDMHGTVSEWCQDWFGEYYYANSPPEDPAGPTGGSHRVARGGNWRYFPRQCRSAFRAGFSPSDRFSDRGFRLARAVS
jgi:formylglycine-generating enzyme required for sulfatase activity